MRRAEPRPSRRRPTPWRPPPSRQPGTDGRDRPDIPALGAHRPHRSATISSPARGSRLFGALVEPGGEAVTRAGPAEAPFGAPLRRVLLSGGGARVGCVEP